jgi:hypothetical protein
MNIHPPIHPPEVWVGQMSKRKHMRFRIGMLVPETGLEPVRGCPQRFLRPQRLPFRHSGAEMAPSYHA